MDEVVGSNPTRRTRFCYAGGRRDTDKNSPAPWRVRLSVHGPLTFNQVKVGSIPTRATNFARLAQWRSACITRKRLGVRVPRCAPDLRYYSRARASYSGSMGPCQGSDVGSIPIARSKLEALWNSFTT